MIWKRPKTSIRREALSFIQRRLRELAEETATIKRETAELRQVAAKHVEYLEALATETKRMSSREADILSILLDSHEQALRRDDDLQAATYDIQATLAEMLQQHASSSRATRPKSEDGSSKAIGYQRLIRRIREVVRERLPRGATVLVVSKGDDELLNLYGRRGWHFPQDADGLYAGYYPASSTAAIAQLEVLRSKGAEFLLFPNTALWWLEYYPEFKRHLESRYGLVASQEDTCLIFALREPAVLEAATWQSKFEEVIAEFQARFDRDPAVLDIDTGLELAKQFPQLAVFSPPTSDGNLPYLDGSIDIIAGSWAADPTAAAEARRVASAAVVAVSRERADAVPGASLEVTWQTDQEAMAPPTVSIIIPSYNGIHYTEPLLVSLRETLPSNFRGEIIVVDDASTDDTQARLKTQARLDKRLRVLRNRKNLGFIMTCNRGAKAAKSEIIIFFNNDTLALPGWLPPLLQIFRKYPDAGAVGGKLIFPDGRLQDAGGVVFSDGSAANFGKWDYEVDAPLYNYVREIDYATGAFIATKRSLFVDSGGFDTRFRPIYYEETDYCFRLREMGYRVYYQPESEIVHYEGATSGTDTSTGDKRYQALNRAKFVEKWNQALKRQPRNPNRFDFETWSALAVRGELEEGGYL